MAKNFVQSGKVITLNAPYDRLSGQGALVGSIFGVAQFDVLSGVAGEFQVTGVHDIAKTSALAISVGDLLYWDDTNKVLNKTSSAQKLVGVAVLAAANPSSTVRVRLNGAFVS